MAGRVRSVYKGKVLKLNVERVKLPNGAVVDLEVAHHPGGAAVVALDAAGRVCLLRQYRHAAGGWITELPAGKIDNREPPLECAKRELAEEAGVTARYWKRLGQFFSSPGVFTEVIHVFLARGLAPCDSAPEAHEVLEARWFPMTEAAALAANGSLPDAKTTIGLFWAQAHLQTRGRAAAVARPGT